MVSKRKIYWKSPLVFVTIGSTQFPFTRLSEAILNCNKIHFNLMHQSYKSNLSEIKLKNLISKADKIIAHAAPSTLYLIANYARNMPLIIPRRYYLGEAVSDHQLYFASHVANCLPHKLRTYVIMDCNILRYVNNYLSQKDETNILKHYLFPRFPRSLFKRSFENLLYQSKINE